MNSLKKELDVEQVYNKFWKGIVEKDGVVDLEEVKKELCDYHFILTQISKVYCYVTGGAASNPMIYAEVINNLADEHYEDIHRDNYEDVLKCAGLDLNKLERTLDIEESKIKEDDNSYV